MSIHIAYHEVADTKVYALMPWRASLPSAISSCSHFSTLQPTPADSWIIPPVEQIL